MKDAYHCLCCGTDWVQSFREVPRCPECKKDRDMVPKYENQIGTISMLGLENRRRVWVGDAPIFSDKSPIMLRAYTSAERKAMPVQVVLAEYFPDAFAAVSRISKAGNDKHNPGEPLHWARKKSTDHLNCAVRHLMTPDGIDPDSGEIELANAAWRVLAALQLREEARLAKAGIMPLSGIVPENV